ncbi:MAG: AsnC family transcriptional regulator [Nanoarchaeota archaeon]|nr:AsnC family transcriptional regulator [Nanoarchaeota archaeon]
MEGFDKGTILSERRPQISLDKKDRKLISALSINARLPPTELGKIVGLSKDSVRYRIKKLKEKGVIRDYALIVNPYALGLRYNNLFLRLHALEEQKEQELIKFLVNHPFTLWCGLLSGSWDIGANFVTKNQEHFNLIVKEIREKFESLIVDFLTLENIKMIKYDNLLESYRKENGISLENKKRDVSFQAYLKKPDATIYDEVKKLDKVDKLIIGYLASKPDMSIADLSEELKLSFNTVKNRIASLIKDKVILSFNPIFNVTSLGLMAFIVLIETKVARDEEEIDNVIKNNPNVGYALKTHGSWDWQLYVGAKDSYEFFSLIRKLRAGLKKNIRRYTSLTIIQDFKFTFFPAGLKKMLKD